ncbi:MAG: pilus assembly PilX N-terminal domain-containing protein [Candidatus Omnitrophica bacterium]|nr:pilus assembly PilX N-terminal domain-containing protein [Candidatus Omnitrophota bacterium]
MNTSNTRGKINKKKGVALVTVLIFVLLVSMVAITSVYLMTNQARQIEKQIRRITAFYSTQAAAVQAREDIFKDRTLNVLDLDPINNQKVDIAYYPATERLETNIIYFP